MGRFRAELHRDKGEFPTTAGGLVRTSRRGALGFLSAVLVFALPTTATAWAIGTAPQSPLTITNVVNTGTAGTPIPLTTGGGSGAGAVTFAVSGVGCTVSGTSLDAAQPGICTVWAISAGDSTYARATSPTVKFTFAGVAQSTLTITNSSTTGYVGTPILLASTGGSGTGATTYAVTGAGCALSGNLLSAYLPATCRVIATRAGSGPYAKVSSTTVVFTFAAASPTDLVLSYPSATGVAGTPISLSSSGGSGNGAVTYSTSGVGCSINGRDLRASIPTKCAAWATKAAEGQFPRMTSLSTSFTFTADTQTALSITNDVTTSGTAGTPLTVTTAGGSGSGARSLSVVGAGCSVNGMTVTATISPTCVVTATKAASGVYALTTSAPVTFTFTGVAQSTFYINNSIRTAPAGSDVTVTSLGGSGSGAVTYSVTGTGCTVTGAVLTATQPSTCTVIGTKAASGSYGPAFTAPVDFTFAGVPQAALNITNAILSADAGTSVTVTTGGGSGTGVVTLVVVGAACRLTGSDLVATETTTCTVTASKAPSGVFARATSAPVIFTFTATTQDTLVISNTTRTNSADTSVTLATTGGSGSGAVTYSATGTGCVVAGALLSATQPTTCSAVATKASSGIYGTATSARVSFTFTAAAQSTLTISNAPTSGVAGTPITLTTSGGSGRGAVTYSVSGTGCTVTGAALTVTQPTSCTVTAYRAASGVYASATSAPVMFTLTAAPQAAFAISNSTTTGLAGTPIAVTVSGGSGSGAVTYAVSGTGCSMTGSSLSATEITTCRVTATKAASGIFAAATSAAVDFTFSGVTQAALLITNVSRNGTAGTPITIDIVGGSGNGALSIAVTGTDCSVSGLVLNTTAPTTCTVIATRAADGIYAAKSSDPYTFLIYGVTQAALVISNASTSGIAGTPITVTTSGGSGTGAVTYAVSGAGCSVAIDALSASQPTTCTVTATKAGSGLFASATSAPVDFTFVGAAQAALVISNASTSGPAGTPITLGTAGGTGFGLVSYAATGTGCSVSGAVLTVTQPTSCTVIATKAASGIYASESSSAVVFTFTAAAQAALVISNASRSGNAGTPIAVTTSGGSGSGTMSYSVSGTGCSMSDAVLSASQPTSCTVSATRGASGVYASETSAPVTFTFAGAAQAAVVITNVSRSGVAGTPLTVTAAGGSGDGALSYSVTGSGCSMTGDVLTTTRVTTCTVTVTRAASGIYASQSSSPTSFTFAGIAQDPYLITNTVTTGPAGTPITVLAIGGSGTGTESLSVTGAGCSASGMALSASQPTTCYVTAVKASSGLYASQSSSQVAFIFAGIAQTPLVISNTVKTGVAGTALLVTTSGGSGAGTNSLTVSGPGCGSSGMNIVVTQPTTCEVRAVRAAQGIYLSETSDPETFTFSAAPQAALVISNVYRSSVAGTPITLATSGGSGNGTVTYALTSVGTVVSDATFNAAAAGQSLDGQVQSTTVQSDGKVVVGGSFTYPSSGLARFNSNGTADTAFNTRVGSVLNDAVRSVAVQSNGKILVGGDFTSPSRYLARFNSDGSPDTTFNANVATNLGPLNKWVATVAVQGDGKVLVGGSFRAPSDYLARFDSNGNPDTAFNATRSIPATLLDYWVTAIAVQSDGKIVIAGDFTAPGAYLARLDSTGAPDATFNANVGSTLDGGAYAVALQPDGKIVLSGYFTAPSNSLARFSSTGLPDVAFNTNVGSTLRAGVRDIALQANGQIVAAGESPNRLTRFDSDGSADTTFNSSAGSSNLNGRVYAVTVQSDGEIVVGGTMTRPGSGLARYAVSGTGCSIVGTSLSASYAASCSVIATKAAEGVYSSQTSPSVAFTFTNP